jgi:hypothetical protein
MARALACAVVHEDQHPNHFPLPRMTQFAAKNERIAEVTDAFTRSLATCICKLL